MKRNMPWTHEEIEELKTLDHLTHRQAGDMLGRTMASISAVRHKLRNGWEGPTKKPQYPWSAKEDSLVKALAGKASAADIAKRLGDRTKEAVNHRMAKLGIRTQAFGGFLFNPNAVGRRPLVAKSCTKCGLLMDSSAFMRIAKGEWSAQCDRCVSVRRKKYYEQIPEEKKKETWEEVARIHKETHEKSLQRADRQGQPYLEEDHKILSNPSLTYEQKAELLGRSTRGIHSVCSDHGYLSKKSPVSRRSYPKWVIDTVA